MSHRSDGHHNASAEVCIQARAVKSLQALHPGIAADWDHAKNQVTTLPAQTAWFGGVALSGQLAAKHPITHQWDAQRPAMLKHIQQRQVTEGPI